MAIEGTLDDFRLTDILQMVAQQQKTGILTVQGDATIVAVSFLGGRVVGADSLEETVEERLGEVLVQEGLLTREDFARVVQEQREGKGRLVDLLVDGGYLDREDVLRSLHRQTIQLLGRLVEWEHGEFKFYANDEVAYEEGFRPIAVDELLLSLLPEEPEEEPAQEGPGAGGPLAEVVPLSPAGRKGRGGQEPEERDWREVSWSGEDLGPMGGGEPALRQDREAERPAAPHAGAPAAATPPPAETERTEREEGEALRSVASSAASPGARHGARSAAPAAWLSAGLAILLAATLLVALVREPGDFLLPLPWQQGELQAYRSVQRQALYQAVDSAAKTYFLKEVRFPDRLERLVELSLLVPEELVGPEGRRLEITPRDDSYELRLEGAESGEPATLEAITGDFLLDPDFLTASEADRSPPLVLLD